MSLNTTRPANELESPQPSAIPGAYPTDDMSGNFAAADTTSSGRNKLHKANDPRGWDQDKTPRTHQDADSGIGMPQSTASGTRDNTYQTSQLRRNVPESSDDRYDGMAGAPTSGLGETGQFQRQQAQPAGARDRDSPLSEGRNNAYTTAQSGLGSSLSKPSEEESNTTSDDPYWGDLPRGGGVYNTVIGHGSTEDAQSHSHRDSEHMAPKPTGATDTSSYGTNQQREFPLTGQSQTQSSYGTDSNREQARDLNDRHDDDRRKGLYEAGGAAAFASAAHSTSRDDNRQQTRDLNDHKDDDRRKGLYEAGGAATVGTAAYPIARNYEQDKHDKHAEKAREVEQPKEKKESKIHALFHRDNSGKDEKPAKAEKPKEKKEHVRHEKQTETVVPVAARRAQEEQPQAQNYSRHTEQSQFRDNNQSNVDSKDSKIKEGLGLGAAGGAAYGATKYAEKEHNKHDAASSTTSSKLTDYRQAENLSSSQQSATNDYNNRPAGDSKYNALSSGTASGVKQENIGGNDNTMGSHSHTEPSTSHTARDATAASAASAAVLGSQYNKPSQSSPGAADKRETYPTEYPTENREQQYTSRSMFDTRESKPIDRSENQYESYNEHQYAKPTDRSEQQYQSYQEQQPKSSMGEQTPKESRNREAVALGGGAAAATGAAALAYKTHESPSEHIETTHNNKSTTSPIHKKPVSASSESGQYNHLSSGTPSGINIQHE